MEKLFTYLMLISGMVLLLHAAGLPTLGGSVMDLFGIEFGDASNFAGGAFAITILGSALVGLAAATVVMGVLGRGSAEIAVTALYATPLVALTGDMLMIIASGVGWVGTVLFLIITPLMAGYVIALYDWVRGRD